MPALGELVDWRAPHARDAREAVGLCPSAPRRAAEVADCAVLRPARARSAAVCDEGFEPAPNAPVVSAELLGPEGRALARAEHDVHELRRASLDAGDLLGVEAELEDVVRLRVPSELRVDDLVRAVRLELEKVGASTPARRVIELGLVDDVGGRLAE